MLSVASCASQFSTHTCTGTVHWRRRKRRGDKMRKEKIVKNKVKRRR
jgi:hypothetical protein